MILSVTQRTIEHEILCCPIQFDDIVAALQVSPNHFFQIVGILC